MLLKEVCTPEVACCGPLTTTLTAARLMRERHVGDLVVVADPDRDSTPLGLVTDRDIVVEVLAKERDAKSTPVQEIMRKPLVVARADEEVSEAIARMKKHGVRRVPVIGEHGRLAGIVCLDDLLRHLVTQTAALVGVLSSEQDHEQRARR
jgi:CBS domain-containing protein